MHFGRRVRCEQSLTQFQIGRQAGDLAQQVDLNIRPLGSTVYLMPPYCITDDELARAYAGLTEGLDRLAANRP